MGLNLRVRLHRLLKRLLTVVHSKTTLMDMIWTTESIGCLQCPGVIETDTSTYQLTNYVYANLSRALAKKKMESPGLDLNFHLSLTSLIYC